MGFGFSPMLKLFPFKFSFSPLGTILEEELERIVLDLAANISRVQRYLDHRLCLGPVSALYRCSLKEFHEKTQHRSPGNSS